MQLRRGNVNNGYKLYVEKFPRKHRNFITKQQYNLIVQRLGEELAYFLIKTGHRLTLPERLGELQVIKYYRSQNKTRYRDYKKTKEIYGEYNALNPTAKKYVYHTGSVTKGLTFGIHWERRKYAMFKNQTRYYFKFTRPNLRQNSYNKTHAKINLVNYFKEVGYRLYDFAETKKYRDIYQSYRFKKVRKSNISVTKVIKSKENE